MPAIIVLVERLVESGWEEGYQPPGVCLWFGVQLAPAPPPKSAMVTGSSGQTKTYAPLSPIFIAFNNGYYVLICIYREVLYTEVFFKALKFVFKYLNINFLFDNCVFLWISSVKIVSKELKRLEC